MSIVDRLDKDPKRAKRFGRDLISQALEEFPRGFVPSLYLRGIAPARYPFREEVDRPFLLFTPPDDQPGEVIIAQAKASGQVLNFELYSGERAIDMVLDPDFEHSRYPQDKLVKAAGEILWQMTVRKFSRVGVAPPIELAELWQQYIESITS